jgi:hypothetical protein
MATCIFENETEFTTGEELTVAELVLAAQDGDRDALVRSSNATNSPCTTMP